MTDPPHKPEVGATLVAHVAQNVVTELSGHQCLVKRRPEK
jgi:hypothetical protein